MTLSTIGVLCQLGATVRLREELQEWLPGFVTEEAEEDLTEEDVTEEERGVEGLAEGDAG